MSVSGGIAKGGSFALLQSFGALGVVDAVFTGGLITMATAGSIYLVHKYWLS